MTSLIVAVSYIVGGSLLMAFAAYVDSKLGK